jgi:N-acetylglucosaminyldiphosphoundecaprenol N-acetyl-beta-D-mannosaminyltransferase
MTVPTVRRVDVLGAPFDAISFEETVAAIEGAVRGDGWLQVVPGNVDFVMKARRDPVFAEELGRADLIVADGVPITWAASLLGTPLRGRVSGTDLVWECSRVSSLTGGAVALVGGAPGVGRRAVERMRERYPGARLHALETPMPLGERESTELARRIRELEAALVLVALGAPRQERWVQRYVRPSGANVGIGVGSAFDIISGDQPRAPRLIRDRGFEWLHRMLLDPRRLARRYLVEDSPFLLHLLRAVVRRRLLGKEAR